MLLLPKQFIDAPLDRDLINNVCNKIIQLFLQKQIFCHK